MPIEHIRTKLAEEPRQLDIEKIGARLLHHGLKIRIDNQFLSDVGDRWCCEITNDDGESVTDNFYGHHAPSLRTAIIEALQGVEKSQHKQKELIND
ncbi:unnamed protein product [marine sediment metagenome]|uniref:Uncharacterized protein n=1 Tax=marine sediment metagenome TaxID=412755 RepID=X0ZMD8_9ZZZZ